MEEISGMFSSPRKPSPLKNMAVMESIEEPSASSWSVSVEMSGINSMQRTGNELGAYTVVTIHINPSHTKIVKADWEEADHEENKTQALA